MRQKQKFQYAKVHKTLYWNPSFFFSLVKMWDSLLEDYSTHTHTHMGGDPSLKILT